MNKKKDKTVLMGILAVVAVLGLPAYFSMNKVKSTDSSVKAVNEQIATVNGKIEKAKKVSAKEADLKAAKDRLAKTFPIDNEQQTVINELELQAAKSGINWETASFANAATGSAPAATAAPATTVATGGKSTVPVATTEVSTATYLVNSYTVTAGVVGERGKILEFVAALRSLELSRLYTVESVTLSVQQVAASATEEKAGVAALDKSTIVIRVFVSGDAAVVPATAAAPPAADASTPTTVANPAAGGATTSVAPPVSNAPLTSTTVAPATAASTVAKG